MIKNIIFDLGNVIVDIDSSRTQRALAELGIQQAEDIFTVQQQNELCDAYECGKISCEDFLKGLLSYSSHDEVDMKALQTAWESMILTSHSTRLETIKSLRQHYKVYVLSNTNQIHYNYLNKVFSGEHAVDTMDNLFDGAYYSFKIGLRKPMPEIFEHVLNEQSLVPDETLFIDDLEKNIATANQLGIRIYHAKNMTDTWSYVSSLLS